MKSDTDFMTMALELAQKGRGYTSPNPMVGAVVVKDGRIVGKGWHEAVGKAHAEVNAIDDAGSLAMGATLYVTLEPCNHTGRTPPCTEKILASGIRRVVMAMEDPNPDVTGGGKARLTEMGVEVVTGVCEDRARKLNEVFIKYIQTKRPFVILKCAATLDGRLATRTGDSRWVTNELSRAYVHELRHAMDAILVGIGTVKADNPSLTTRLEGRSGKDPVRIILDSKLSISPDANVLRLHSQAPTWVITGNGVDPETVGRIERDGVQVMETPLKHNRIDLAYLMDVLGKKGVTSVLIEGGSQVIASALAQHVVDKIHFFYAPKILGGDDGVPVCSGPGPQRMADSIQVRDVTVHRFGDDIMIEGYVGS